MRLIMAYWPHAQTTANRQSTGGESTADRCPHHRYGRTACGPSGAAPRGGLGHVGANRCHLGCGSSHRGSIAATLRQSVRPAAARRARWGGRRQALLSVEHEAQFLAPWAEQAKQAGVLVLSPIRAALAQRLGRPVAASVVWRLLARHGWRKVAPDTRHPKSDLVAQQAWKKNSPKRWLPS